MEREKERIEENDRVSKEEPIKQEFVRIVYYTLQLYFFKTLISGRLVELPKLFEEIGSLSSIQLFEQIVIFQDVIDSINYANLIYNKIDLYEQAKSIINSDFEKIKDEYILNNGNFTRGKIEESFHQN